MARMENETLEGVKIRWRNFEGRAGQFNAEGERNFTVELTPEHASELAEKGWPVKMLPAREEGENEFFFMKVKVKYSAKARPPRVVLVSSKGRTNLTEDMLVILDWADIANVDMIVRPFEWEMRGKTGVTAYLNSIYVTIREDELEMKYADVPELEGAQKSITAGSTPGNEFEDLGEFDEQLSIEAGN